MRKLRRIRGERSRQPSSRIARPGYSAPAPAEPDHGEGWFRTDAEKLRIEWGAEGSAYHGWMQVSAEGEGSRLTLFLATSRGDAPDSEVMGTLDAIRRLVEAGA